MEDLDEVLPFLSPDARLDLKNVALQAMLGLTGTKDGVALLSKSPQLIDKFSLLMRDDCKSVSKDAALALINISAEVEPAREVLEASAKTLVPRLWDMVTDKTCAVADPASMVLSNLSIDRENCSRVSEVMPSDAVETAIDMLCGNQAYNEKGGKLHYVATLLSNLSQMSEVRARLLDRERCVLQRLLPFTEYAASKVRRGGVIGAIRNCCFDETAHKWMLGPDVDILPRLLLPLAGPAPDDWTTEEMEGLPLDLQYLDDDKVVEEDPDLRRMILESLLQLCATRKGRENIRNQKVYVILRELHRQEQDQTVRLACENVVDLLIKKEEEIGLDNYKEVSVPDEIVPQLEAIDLQQ